MSPDPISREEAVQLRVDVENLKVMHQGTIDALKGNEEATKENSSLLSELLRKMDKHDTREEHRDSQIEQIQEDIKEIKNKRELERDIISRAKKSQDRWDLFFNSMTSRAGIAVLIIVSIGIALAFNLDLSKVFK